MKVTCCLILSLRNPLQRGVARSIFHAVCRKEFLGIHISSGFGGSVVMVVGVGIKRRLPEKRLGSTGLTEQINPQLLNIVIIIVI